MLANFTGVGYRRFSIADTLAGKLYAFRRQQTGACYFNKDKIG